MEEDIEDKVFKAYYRKFGKYALRPSNLVEFIEHKKKNYAVLSNVNGILAVINIDGERLRFVTDEKLLEKIVK